MASSISNPAPDPASDHTTATEDLLQLVLEAVQRLGEAAPIRALLLAGA